MVNGPAPLCRDQALAGLILPPRLDPSQAEAVLASDRLLARSARRLGHSHALVGRKAANKRAPEVLAIAPLRRIMSKSAPAALLKAGRAEYRKTDKKRMMPGYLAGTTFCSSHPFCHLVACMHVFHSCRDNPCELSHQK